MAMKTAITKKEWVIFIIIGILLTGIGMFTGQVAMFSYIAIAAGVGYGAGLANGLNKSQASQSQAQTKPGKQILTAANVNVK